MSRGEEELIRAMEKSLEGHMDDVRAVADKLRIRLEESRKQRECETVHPRECRCGGHGNLPMSQFSIGYVKCEG